MGFERHPDDPTRYRQDAPKPGWPGFTPRYVCFVSIVPENKANKNNEANRKKWADKLVALNNCPKLQGMSKYECTLAYKADLTPVGDTEPPPLSQFLTLRDTMEVIRIAYKTPDGEMPSIEDLLADESILDMYYSRDLIPKVRHYFGADQESNDKARDSNHPDLGGVYIEPFDFD